MTFDPYALEALAESRRQDYAAARPFPHTIIPAFVADPWPLYRAMEDFPQVWQQDLYRYDNALERKLAQDQLTRLKPAVAHVLQDMNGPHFLRFLERLTSISGLIPDPYYRGGGAHLIQPGGKLDVHVDYNVHPHLGLHRRVNALLYLNHGWRLEWGGELELWEGHQEVGPPISGTTRCEVRHVLHRCARRIPPLFNTLVVFTTSESSYHGHPEPLRCPEGQARKSLSCYYYTVPEESQQPHSTTFIARPGEEGDGNEELRARRNAGRLASPARGFIK
ncbi:MAG: 2OG-Fe(II) oxygenase [Myxococcaceae bacterium]|nr:2OG-Fe(II) oxygenase [Myxococcaceae bacterium]